MTEGAGPVELEAGELRCRSFVLTEKVARGTFGTVYKVADKQTGETLAVKRVRQDPRTKSRELALCLKLKELDHPNIHQMRSYYYTRDGTDIYLHLVLGYSPCDLSQLIAHYNEKKRRIPFDEVKLYSYQIARALLLLHSLSICHRDLKPANVLVDPVSRQARVCDFGSAKVLKPGEPNIAYISSRYYRAPELVLGATEYTCSVDTWAYGCIVAEMLRSKVFLRGKTSAQQIVEIVNVFGMPSERDVFAMTKSKEPLSLPPLDPVPLSKMLGKSTPPLGIELISSVLVYAPMARLPMVKVLAHGFFDELRSPTFLIGNPAAIPPLFNFNTTETSVDPLTMSELVPQHLPLDGPSALRS